MQWRSFWIRFLFKLRNKPVHEQSKKFHIFFWGGEPSRSLLSVKIFLKVGKFHFHAPIRALFLTDGFFITIIAEKIFRNKV